MTNLEAEKYFLAIANTTNDMIHLNDLEGRIIYANHATETILGYPVEQVVARPAFDIIHPDDQDAIKNAMRSLVTDNRMLTHEIRLLKSDGSYIEVEVRGFLVDLEEQKYIGAVIRDISARKKTEKELAKYQENLEELVRERTGKLENALAEIKTLKGILPICMHCKKIRDDEGYWNQIESYIHARSEAEFSHSICPGCMEEHYPEVQIKMDKSQSKP